MSGGHSEVVPRLPIPNRTVKRLSADDSADARVKVGHRQAFIPKAPTNRWALFLLILNQGPIDLARTRLHQCIKNLADPTGEADSCKK